MKDCTHIKKLLYPYLDGELDAKQNLDVEFHIFDCQQCCDLLNEEKRFLSAIRNGCLQKEGPAALKVKIEKMLDKKKWSLFRIFSNFPFQMAFAAALAGLLILIFTGRLLDFGSGITPPFVKASFENHLKYVNGNLPLQIESNDPRVVEAWFKKRINFIPHLPVLEDDSVVLLGGRLADFKGEVVALVGYRIENTPVTMLIIRGNPAAFVESRDFTFMNGRRFNFSGQKGLSSVSWTNKGNSFAIITTFPAQTITGCAVCHSNGSGLPDLNTLLEILNT